MGSPDAELPVLIVDDDEDAHFFLRRELKRAGMPMAVKSVFGGSEAIAHLDGCRQGTNTLPVVVFVDIMMPGVDGFGVLDWMKSTGLLGRVTVAMLTSSDNPADVSRSMGMGAHVFLTKPAKAEQLQPLVVSAANLAGRPLAGPPRSS